MTIDSARKLLSQQRHMDILEDRLLDSLEQLKIMRTEHEEIMYQMSRYEIDKRLFSERELTKFMRRYRYQTGRWMKQDLRKLLAHNQMDALIWLTGGIKEFNELGRDALNKRLAELQQELEKGE